MNNIIDIKRFRNIYIILFIIVFTLILSLNRMMLNSSIFQSLISAIFLTIGILMMVEKIIISINVKRNNIKEIKIFYGTLHWIGFAFFISIILLKIHEWYTHTNNDADFYFILLPLFINVFFNNVIHLDTNRIIISGKEFLLNEIKSIKFHKSKLGMYVLTIYDEISKIPHTISLVKKSKIQLETFFEMYTSIDVDCD